MIRGTDSKEGVMTNWDGSKLTTIRVHEIMCAMHECTINLTLSNRLKFLDLCECLYTEGINKMTKTEEKEAEGYREVIGGLKTKHGSSILKPRIKDQENISYFVGWDEIWLVAIQFQRFLVKSLDSHGMLMKNAARIEDNI